MLIIPPQFNYRKIVARTSAHTNCCRYARLYLAIQFFDSRSLLPPPFTYLTIILYFVRWASRTTRQLDLKMSGKGVKDPKVTPAEMEYRSLIFAFIDNCKPTPKIEQAKGKSCISSISLEH